MIQAKDPFYPQASLQTNTTGINVDKFKLNEFVQIYVKY